VNRRWYAARRGAAVRARC